MPDRIITPGEAAIEAALSDEERMSPTVIALFNVAQVLQQHTQLLQSIVNQQDLLIRLRVGNKHKTEVFNELKAWDDAQAKAVAAANAPANGGMQHTPSDEDLLQALEEQDGGASEGVEQLPETDGGSDAGAEAPSGEAVEQGEETSEKETGLD